ncbi:MAG: hypothetical protein F4Y35_08770 [Chloroflexi bacterium]|nr:hypothetical protein [Chloroflexota bacterium]
MTETQPTDGQVRSYVVNAAVADDSPHLLCRNPLAHAREKGRQVRPILANMEVRRPHSRPLCRSSALLQAARRERLDIELRALAGLAFLTWLSEHDLKAFKRSWRTFDDQYGMELMLEALPLPGEQPRKAGRGWPCR